VSRRKRRAGREQASVQCVSSHAARLGGGTLKSRNDHRTGVAKRWSNDRATRLHARLHWCSSRLQRGVRSEAARGVLENMRRNLGRAHHRQITGIGSSKSRLALAEPHEHRSRSARGPPKDRDPRRRRAERLLHPNGLLAPMAATGDRCDDPAAAVRCRTAAPSTDAGDLHPNDPHDETDSAAGSAAGRQSTTVCRKGRGAVNYRVGPARRRGLFNKHLYSAFVKPGSTRCAHAQDRKRSS